MGHRIKSIDNFVDLDDAKKIIRMVESDYRLGDLEGLPENPMVGVISNENLESEALAMAIAKNATGQKLTPTEKTLHGRFVDLKYKMVKNIYNNDTSALSTNTEGNNNTAIGRSALSTNTASNNTAVGFCALRYNTTGTSNTAIGLCTLLSNTTGARNLAVGTNALQSNTTSINNTALGFISPRPGFIQKDYDLCVTVTADNAEITADQTNVTADGWSEECYGPQGLTGTFQCALPYISDDGRTFILLMISGKVWLYNCAQNNAQNLTTSPDLENPSNLLDGWMVQAENFVVIQDGFSKPLIFNGTSLRRAKDDEIKTGRVMAYVNGRIWYALPNGFSFRATDIVYGDGTRASRVGPTHKANSSSNQVRSANLTLLSSYRSKIIN